MQLLDQQAETAADTATTEQGVKQEQGRAAKHRDGVDRRLAEPAYAFY
jgi:hypothetical protein